MEGSCWAMPICFGCRVLRNRLAWSYLNMDELLMSSCPCGVIWPLLERVTSVNQRASGGVSSNFHLEVPVLLAIGKIEKNLYMYVWLLLADVSPSALGARG